MRESCTYGCAGPAMTDVFTLLGRGLQIWTNLFGGSKKNSEENSEK